MQRVFLMKKKYQKNTVQSYCVISESISTAAEESKQYPENLISQMEDEKCTMCD